MKGLSTIFVICSFLLLSTGAQAQDAMAQVTSSGRLVVGAQLGFGLEWGARSKDFKDAMDEGFGLDIPGAGGSIDVSNSAGFSAGGWLYVDYYLIPLLALEGGLGFVGKGAHYKYEGDVGLFSVDGDDWIKMAYMEIPLGVKLNFMNIRLSGLILLNIALTGKYKSADGNNSSETKFDDDDWDTFRRFNLGFRLQAGYAIPIGPIVLVPGVDWSFHFIDEFKDDDIDDKYQVRWMNFFFNVAAEFALPI